MAASGQYPNELPEVLEFLVGDELIGIRGGVLFRAPTSTLPEGAAPVTVVDSLISTSTTAALSAKQGKVLQDTKAPIDSPTFTGVPTAPTPDGNDDSTTLATTAFVQRAVATSLDARVTTQTASYNLSTDQAANNDGKTYLRMNVASANTVTIPSTQTKPISIRQAGAGVTTIQAGAGVTLNGTLAFTGQNQTKTVIPIGGGIFDIVG